MQLHKGKVKFAAGAPEDRGYGESINVPFEVPGLSSPIRIYCKTTAPEYAYMASLQKGQDVDLVEDKGKFKVMVPAAQAPAQGQQAQTANPLTDPAQAPRAPAPAAQQATGNSHKKICALYASIWHQLQQDLGVTVPDAVLVQATEVVFKEAVKGL